MPHSKYLFMKRRLAIMVWIVDAIGNLFFPRKKRPIPEAVRRVLVIRLDHLGDVVFAEPFLRELKAAKPGWHLTLLASPGGTSLLEKHPGIDEILTFDAVWFREGSSFWQFLEQWRSLIRLLRKVPCDAIFDLRGDFRHILAARMAHPKGYVASFGVTGGGFLLDCEVPWKLRVHESRRNMEFLECLGIKKLSEEEPQLSPLISCLDLDDTVRACLPEKKRRWVALHMSCGTQAKAWPLRHWKTLTERLLRSTDFVFFCIGDSKACSNIAEVGAFLAEKEEGRFIDLCGRLPLSQLGTFLRMCDLLVSSDSGPAHVAASHGVDTLVLFSGTNEVHEWKPLSQRSWILFHEVPCSPCHLRRCPKPKHYCMEDLDPAQVYDQARKILEGQYEKHSV